MKKATGLRGLYETPEVVEFPDRELGTYELVGLYNWYNYNTGVKDARRYAQVHFTGDERFDKLGLIPDPYFPRAAAATFRLHALGAQLPADYLPQAETKFDETFLKFADGAYQRQRNESAAMTREQMADHEIATILHLIPEDDSDFDFGALLDKNKFPKHHIRELIKRLEALAELNPAHQETWIGYASQARNYAGLAPKGTRRRSKNRKVDPAKEIRKLQYLPEFLEWKSIDPINIVGAKEVWTLNTRYSILTVYRSNDEIHVKGTTLYGFDAANSHAKRIGNRVEYVETVIDRQKAAVDKVIDKISSKRNEPTGRINGDTLILRAFR